ncbi:hypothetical protein Aple_082810 [Acrocarpospora pleiomorpha]|uniref:Uncharacterized protein n=1 Tax=Acrocarpospora pleiomorpha TaxID=90975 RepID=A0A5M3XWN6_9ACTN|nr:hypothetical protein Aple_082810 [Acrocarpospora pleiomorpha]
MEGAPLSLRQIPNNHPHAIQHLRQNLALIRDKTAGHALREKIYLANDQSRRLSVGRLSAKNDSPAQEGACCR